MPQRIVWMIRWQGSYNSYITMRFHFSGTKSERLRANPKRGIGFEEVQEVFSHPYYLDQRSDAPEQYRAIGWVGNRLYSVVFEAREDQELYEEHS